MRRFKTSLTLLACYLGIAVAQEASSIDADGNTVLYSVGLDAQGLPTTIFLETIPASAASTIAETIGDGVDSTPTTDVDLASAVRPAVLPDPTSNPVITRNDDLEPGETTSSRPPITYIVYLTIDGVQVTSIATFTPSTPTPTTTIPPLSGTIVDIATYLPPPPPSSSTTSAGSDRYQLSAHAWKASLGVATSILFWAWAVL